ncbi:MAG TPA: hypothetical protein DDW20_02050 [Firmicutes bacterium]|nr:hypothetical protein [Bacillota bacterium]
MFYIFASTNPTDNQFNEILKNYILPISIAVAALIFISVLILFIVVMVKNKKNKVIKSPLPDNQILEALGGKDNVINATLIGSRLNLVLKNYDVVNENQLNNLGVDSVIKMSNKIILVSKDDLNSVYKQIINR